MVGEPDEKPHRISGRVAPDRFGRRLALDLEPDGLDRQVDLMPRAQALPVDQGPVRGQIRGMPARRDARPGAPPAVDKRDRRQYGAQPGDPLAPGLGAATAEARERYAE